MRPARNTASRGAETSAPTRWIYLFIFVVGTLSLCRGIDVEAIWFDEAYSAAAAGQEVVRLIPMIAEDSHPPLYFIYLRIFTSLFGFSATALRSASILWVIGLAALGPTAVTRMWGRTTGLVFSTVVFLTPAALFMGQETRMYAMLAFGTTAAFLYGHLACRQNRMGDWVRFGAYLLLSCYTHHYGTLAAGWIWTFLLVRVLFKRRGTLLRPIALTGGAVLAGYSPMVAVIANQASRVVRNYWIPPLNGDRMREILLFPFNHELGIHPNAPVLGLFCLGLIGVSLAIAFLRQERDRVVIGGGLFVCLATLGIAVVLSATIKPILVPRYTSSYSGIVMVLVSRAVVRLAALMSTGVKPDRSQYAAFFTLALVAAYGWFSLPVIQSMRAVNAKGPMKQIVAALDGRVGSGDLFIHGDENNLGSFAYYFPDHWHYLYVPDGFLQYSNNAVFNANSRVGSAYEDLLDLPVNIWVTTRITQPYPLPLDAFRHHAHRRPALPPKTYTLPPGWYQVTVRRYDYVE